VVAEFSALKSSAPASKSCPSIPHLLCCYKNDDFAISPPSIRTLVFASLIDRKNLSIFKRKITRFELRSCPCSLVCLFVLLSQPSDPIFPSSLPLPLPLSLSSHLSPLSFSLYLSLFLTTTRHFITLTTLPRGHVWRRCLFTTQHNR